jgi:hypothetical protein
MEQFIVMCSVSGGATGHRTAPLKRDGEVRHFDTREEAQAEADRLMSVMKGGAARFRYWPERLELPIDWNRSIGP